MKRAIAMPLPYSQTGRMMAIDTPLGPDVLLLDRLDVHESINGLFEIRASVKSQRDDLQAGDLIGSTVDFSLRLKDGGTRVWNGFVIGLHEGPLTTRGTRSYAMTVRPKLWLLSQKSDCRIFQDLATPAIIEILCKEHGVFDFQLRLTGEPVPQPYSVQWNETDLAYMLRRMEEDGYFYWHAHEKGKHTLVVADHQYGYRAAPQPEVRYTLGSADQDRISDWRRGFAFTPGKRSGRDWNWQSMQTPGATQSTFAVVPGNADHELYEYPGRFADTTSADQAMKSRIQATETGFETVEGASSVRTLGPGMTFTPFDTAKPDHKFAKQVVTAIRHVAVDPTYEAAGGVPSYDNTFTVMPAQTPATPHRATPRPKIIGQQIALIAGPEGEEIHTNAYGQVKVWFPWDRRAMKDGSDTCWIRVGQPWAGGGWGYQTIPRVGMEALVSFQDGDPDRPFVMALVPDTRNKVPYPLPENKTRTVMRSNSYKSTGFNEMTFEDKTGAENMFFHAQKDHTTKIENNQTNSVGANHSNVVGQNQALTVGGNVTQEVGGSHNITVGATGVGTAALMAPFVGMAGITADMLRQALTAAGSNGQSGDAPGTSDNGQHLASLADELAGNAAAIAPQLAASLIGLLNQAGLQAQQKVGNGPSPRPDAGTALAQAGALFGEAVGTLFNLPGLHNHITGTMKTDHCGCARVEQVGTSKVTNVGSTFGTRVGKAWALHVGSDATTKVGDTWSVAAKKAAIISAGETVTYNAGETLTATAGHDLALKSGIHLGIEANEDINIFAKTITLATEGAKILLLKDQIQLIAGAASITIGPGQVLSQPLPVVGTSGGTVGILAKTITKETTGSGILADVVKQMVDDFDKKGSISRMFDHPGEQGTPLNDGTHGVKYQDGAVDKTPVQISHGRIAYPDGTISTPQQEHIDRPFGPSTTIVKP